jgi:hypothetical protein
MSPEPAEQPADPQAELVELRAEVDRLRHLIGPSEPTYIQLQLDVWSARDAVIGAEAANGVLRARMEWLEMEVDRLKGDDRWLREQAVRVVRRLERKGLPLGVLRRPAR